MSNIFTRMFFQEAEQRHKHVEEPIDPNGYTANGNGVFRNFLQRSTTGMSLSAVFAATEIICSTLAEIPIYVKKINQDGDKEIDQEHPIAYAFDNALVSKFTMIKNAIRDMYIYGNGYIYIKRSGDVVTGLQYCPPGTVSINYNPIKQELFYTSSNVGTKVRIAPKNMIHFIKVTNDGIHGIGVLAYAKNTIDLANYTETAAANYFASGCNVKGVLKTNGPLNPKQRDDLLKDWAFTYSVDGSSNNGGIIALPGSMEFQAISANANEAQLIESRLFNIQEVARFFSISPVMLGDLSHSSYSTIEASNLQFLTQTLQPIISLIEHELNRKLLSDNEKSLYKIDLDEQYLLRGDKQSTATYYSTLTSAGIMTINEARHQLGLSPKEGGDDLQIAYTDTNQNKLGNSDDAEETSPEKSSKIDKKDEDKDE